MKIAVTAQQPSLDSPVDPRFGRCSYFLVVDPDNLNFEPLENSNISSSSGAGIQSAQLMADKGVKFVLTGNCGPNAHQTLSAAGIKVIVGASGSVREAIDNFKNGAYPAADQPSVAGHFGMGTAPAAGSDIGRGMGRGMGMGGGGGRGMGRGMGMGGGGGRGMGRGMGMGGGGGRGMGRGMGMGGGMDSPDVGQPYPPAPPTSTPKNEKALLKEQAEALARQLAEIKERLKRLDQKGPSRTAAIVDPELCTGCGACVEACPNNAIGLREGKAVVVERDCIMCGSCVDICPEDAITLP